MVNIKKSKSLHYKKIKPLEYKVKAIKYRKKKGKKYKWFFKRSKDYYRSNSLLIDEVHALPNEWEGLIDD